MKTKSLVILSAIAFVSGCASNLKYGPAKDQDAYGYTETAISEQEYRVAFNGKRKIRNDKLADFALRRAAELTVNNGFDWFAVLNANSSAKATTEKTVSVADVTYEFTKVQGRPGLTMQQVGKLSQTLGARPGSVSAPRPFPSISLDIKMGRGLAPENELSFDAREILGMVETT